MVKTTTALAALTAAAQNLSYSLLPAAMTGGAVAINGFVDLLGPRWVAVIFALIAACWRWFHFGLKARAGFAGLMLPAAFAFATGEGSLPFVGQFLVGLDAPSRTMWNGLLLGLFIVMAFGVGQDFLSAYMAKKAKSQ